MTSFALILTLAAFGVSETVYLIKKRMYSEKPFCPIGGCEAVLKSKYSKIFFLPNDWLGLGFYLCALVLTALLVLQIAPVFLWAALLGYLLITGSVISVFLTYLQWRVIKSWCLWCLMSALTIWLMTFIIYSV